MSASNVWVKPTPYYSPHMLFLILREDNPKEKIRESRDFIESINEEAMTEEEWESFQYQYYETDSEDEDWNAKYRPTNRPPTKKKMKTSAKTEAAKETEPEAKAKDVKEIEPALTLAIRTREDKDPKQGLKEEPEPMQLELRPKSLATKDSTTLN